MSRLTATITASRLTRSALVLAFGVGAALVPAAAGAQNADPAVGSDRSRETQAAASDAGIEWTTGWSYGARGSISLLTEDSLETGFGLSGFAVLPLGSGSDFELEGEIGYHRISTIANGLPAGNLSTFPLRATLRVQLWRFGGAMPYAGGGAGVYINRFSIDDAVLDELATVGFDASADVDPALAFHAAGGVEWQSGRVHFGVDVKYVVGSAETTATLVDELTGQVFRETSDVGLDGLWISGGARISF